MQVELKNLTRKFDQGSILAVDDLSLSIPDGEFLTLVGPSGCGKSTTLRMIAGLESVTEGKILIGGTDVTELPPQERDIAMVFQDYALYPHMTAGRNMSFALEDEGSLSSTKIDEKVEETAEMLGIIGQLDKKPKNLSGGQQQRVALGRSIVRDPDVFLLDEPLSNLDAKLRTSMRAELQQLQERLDATMIYVTHDQEEAMTMSDRIAIMNDGRLQQLSSPDEAYNEPTNRFVAEFVGSPSMNFLPASVRRDTLTFGPFEEPLPSSVADDVAEVGIRPEDFGLGRNPSGSDVYGTVEVFEQLGSFNIAYLSVSNREEHLVVQTPVTQQFDIGNEVSVELKDTRIHLFNHDGQTVFHPPNRSTIPQSQ